MLYGPDNKPIEVKQDKKSAVLRAYSQYLGALFKLDSPPSVRSRDPLSNHAWVYAAAMIRAVNLAQAPFYIYQETEETTESRQRLALKRGDMFRPGRGERRRALSRHLSGSGRWKGQKIKSLEIDLDNPLQNLFIKPNEVMSGDTLFQIGELWLSLRGEVFWVLIRKDGIPLGINEDPEEIWPVSPDLMEPVILDNRLVGWWYTTRKDTPIGAGVQRKFLNLWEVAQFKYPNPMDPYRGISPLAAAAAGIDLDMQIKSFNRSLIANGCQVAGFMSYEGVMDDDEEAEALKKIEARHKGALNTNRVGLLSGKWNWVPTTLNPADLAYGESLKWDRDEIFAILRVPKTIAGITDDIPYATQLGQDKNLWDKSLLPDIRMIEGVIDASILYNHPDSVVGAFDLSGIEALRQGLSESIDAAKKLMAQDVHMPPKVAFEMVGMTDIPEYEGSELALVSPLMVPISYLLEPVPVEEPETDPEEPETERYRRRVRKMSQTNRWKMFIATQQVLEKKMKRSWVDWVAEIREAQMRQFDKATKALDVEKIVLNLDFMKSELGVGFRPLYHLGVNTTYDLVASELGGVPIFDLDDPDIVRAMEKRYSALIDTAPKTTRNRLIKSISQGIQAGETVQQLRIRVSEVFNIAASSGKSLAIARTESASFMNGLREEMFSKQGFKKMEWITAGDEHVRPDHVVFGEEGPTEFGFNYMSLVGGGGTLKFPGDPDAPVGQVINCRCMRGPVS